MKNVLLCTPDTRIVYKKNPSIIKNQKNWKREIKHEVEEYTGQD